jgi:dTMP kinase
MSQRGLFIAIEGGDGSGKGTQAERLKSHFETAGTNVFKTSFPQYEKDSSYYVRQYLNGNYGSIDEVHPDLASLAYAIDRFEASAHIKAKLDESSIVIADRYVASNLAHQGTKFSDATERKTYYERDMQLEYEILGIPRPDINIVLIMPTALAQANVDKKAAETRQYIGGKKRDIHEDDANHLDKAKRNYEELCQLYPAEFVAVQCIDEQGNMRSIEEVGQEIQTIIDRYRQRLD